MTVAICEAIVHPSELWPWCICQQRAVPGSDFCARHLAEHEQRLAALIDGEARS